MLKQSVTERSVKVEIMILVFGEIRRSLEAFKISGLIGVGEEKVNRSWFSERFVKLVGDRWRLPL